MKNYPGKKAAEALVRPAARSIASQTVIAAVGWWHLRQYGDRAQLVAAGVSSRSASYRMERSCEEIFGKPVDRITAKNIAQALGVDDIEAGQP